MDRLNRDFIWSNDLAQRKTHLVGWKQVTQPKKQGGLGIREARLNNEALLSKVVWMELIQRKYLKGGCIQHYSAKPGDSPMWKGVVKCAQKLSSSFRWRVGGEIL